MPEPTVPKRIQRRRVRGWRKPEGAICVDRSTKWGNPYRWTEYPKIAYDCDGEPFVVSDDTRRRYAVASFKAALTAPFNDPPPGYPTLTEIRRELAGKVLACPCPLEDADGNPVPCHADVLLEIANEQMPAGR